MEQLSLRGLYVLLVGREAGERVEAGAAAALVQPAGGRVTAASLQR